MRKVALFTEGQTETIFVREFLHLIIDLSSLSYDCVRLLGSKGSRLLRSYASPEPKVHFLILECGGDEAVLSTIADREKGLIDAGYERIIGLRDMYCQLYDGLSGGVIKDSVTQNLIHRWNSTIEGMRHSDKIVLFVAIMETEAWFLGMCSIFARIAPVLDVNHIANALHLDLKKIDPETEFYRPSRIVEQVLGLCGLSYGKTVGDIERIASQMQKHHFDEAVENGRCASFAAFRNEMEAWG